MFCKKKKKNLSVGITGQSHWDGIITALAAEKTLSACVPSIWPLQRTVSSNNCLSYSFGHCLEKDYETHMKREEEAPEEKKKKDKRTSEDDSFAVIAVDLQVVLLAPRLFANTC